VGDPGRTVFSKTELARQFPASRKPTCRIPAWPSGHKRPNQPMMATTGRIRAVV